jgi:uncharacterized protein
MTKRLLQVTAMLHIAFGFVLFANLRPVVGTAFACLAAGALATVLALPARRRIHNLMHDRPMSRMRIQLIELPYFVHWCGCVAMTLPATVCLAIAAWSQANADARLWNTVAACCYIAGCVVAMWGIYLRRYWFSIFKHDIEIAKLPEAFDGYRIAHLSDLHIGALTPKAWAQKWTRAAVRVQADLIVVTGDLVTNGTEFHLDIAEALGGLQARDGVIVTMGNHDYFGDGEPLMSLLLARGLRVVRNEGVRLVRGADTVYLGCADDTYTQRANVDTAIAGRDPSECTLLLAHDPELFEQAANAGVSLTLSGHTHAGQIALPFLGRFLSLAHLTHQYRVGLYARGDAQLYVHPGLGTTGPPIRIGTTPTIAVHTLRCTPSAAGRPTAR